MEHFISVRLSEEDRERLIALRTRLQADTHRAISLGEVVRQALRALDDKKPAPADTGRA